jgi:hypothetical protein
MTELFPRHRWLRAVSAASVLLVTSACSGGSSTTPRAAQAHSSAASPPAGSAAPATTDATAALRRAAAATRALHSYQFNAEQTVTGGSTPQATQLSGRVVRPSALTYILVAGGHTQQIVRLGTVAYRRVPPAGYRRLAKPLPLVDPLDSVIKILSRLTAVTSRRGSNGTDFTGTLSGTAAAAAGLVGNAVPAPGLAVPVSVRVDSHGLVTQLRFTAPLVAGSRQLVLRQIATYGGFNTQAPILRPR